MTKFNFNVVGVDRSSNMLNIAKHKYKKNKKLSFKFNGKTYYGFKGDTLASALLSNDVVLITGTDSDVFIGREEQLNLWISDFTNDSRLIYLRSPNCIKLSNLHPIAMEYARWRGARPASDKNFVGGDYVAKWRLIDDHWTIDAETYMTNECGGSLCGGEK